MLTAPRACAGQAAGRSAWNHHTLYDRTLRSASSSADARLDRAEVLADHERAGPVGFQGHDVEQVVVGVAHVAPRRRAWRRPGSSTAGTAP